MIKKRNVRQRWQQVEKNELTTNERVRRISEDRVVRKCLIMTSDETSIHTTVSMTGSEYILVAEPEKCINDCIWTQQNLLTCKCP